MKMIQASFPSHKKKTTYLDFSVPLCMRKKLQKKKSSTGTNVPCVRLKINSLANCLSDFSYRRATDGVEGRADEKK